MIHVDTINVVNWTRRLATLVGTSVFLGGIVLLAMGIPSRRGTIGWELVLGQAVPWWLFLLSYTGGPLVLILGAIVGVRYGNFERYHKDYDPETGTIDSDHPFAAIHARVTADRLGPDDPPEKFVFGRTHLVATIAVVTLPVIGFLYFSGIDGTILHLAVGTLVVGAVGSIVYLDHRFRNSDEYDYGV